MKLTEKQAIQMFVTLCDSVGVIGRFSLGGRQRAELVDEILRQQDNGQFLEFVEGEEEKLINE